MAKTPNTLRWTLLFLGLGSILTAAFFILKPFIVGIAWSVVLVLTTWPLYERLRARVFKHRSVAAGVMVLGVGILVLGTIIPLVTSLVNEIQEGSRLLRESWPGMSQSIAETLQGIPKFGDAAAELFNKIIKPTLGRMDRILALASEYHTEVLDVLTFAVGGLLGAFIQFLVVLFTSYFFYYHGDDIGKELEAVAYAVFGSSAERILTSTRQTIRGAVYGVIVTAFVQGFLAGIGYVVAGAPIPIFLAIVTIFFSLIPMGPPIVYLPVTLIVAMQSGSWVIAGLLLLWNVVVVSGVDNLIRPAFISQATNTSMAVVFFGVLGGIITFGLIGVFVGPAILVLLQLLIKEVAYSGIYDDAEN